MWQAAEGAGEAGGHGGLGNRGGNQVVPTFYPFEPNQEFLDGVMLDIFVFLHFLFFGRSAFVAF